MEQQAMSGAMQQKMVKQQSSQTGTKPSSQSGSSTQPTPPREVSTLGDELFKRPMQDISKEIRQFFNINRILGINVEDSPEVKAKKTKLHQRFQQLTEAEQQEAKKKYQQALQRKQAEEKRKQQLEQEKQQANDNVLPSVGKVSRRGTALLGGGSAKKQAAARIANDRQRIGKLSNTG